MHTHPIASENIESGDDVGEFSQQALDLPALEQTIEPKSKWYLWCKSAAEFVIALLILILVAPVLFFAALLIKLTSPGPALYCQTRLGKDGRRFILYKLRTMVDNAEALTGPMWAKTEDARVTKVGRFMRRTHLDEFPQILNVLLGQMSLIGPRPERPEFVTKLEWHLPSYRTRLRVRPGITGLAQLNLPPDSDLESVGQKLLQDLYYVRHMNPWLDFRILVFTTCYFVRELWCSCWKLFNLPDPKFVNQHLHNDLVEEQVADEPSRAG